MLAPEERDSPNSGNLDSDSLEGDDDLLAPEEASLLRRDAGRGELDNWSPIAPANPVQLNGEHLLRDASRSNRLLPPPVEQHSPDGLLKPDPRLERLPPVLKATRADLWW